MHKTFLDGICDTMNISVEAVIFGAVSINENDAYG